MKISDKEKITIAYYDQNANVWAVKHGLGQKREIFLHAMQQFFNYLPLGKIIEIGSGYGGDARELIKHYGVDNYIGVEPAKGLLTIAHKQNPNATFLQKSIYSLDFPANSFNGFWTSAVLIHLPKNRLAECLTMLKKITKDSGIGFISVLEGEGDMEESRPGRYYTLWKKEKFEEILKNNNFTILYFEKIETDESPWFVYVIKNNK